MSTQDLPMIDDTSTATRTTAPSTAAGMFGKVSEALWDYIAAYIYRRALRRAEVELMMLDDRMLHDIGLARGEIPAAVRRAEANLLMPIVPH